MPIALLFLFRFRSILIGPKVRPLLRYMGLTDLSELLCPGFLNPHRDHEAAYVADPLKDKESEDDWTNKPREGAFVHDLLKPDWAPTWTPFPNQAEKMTLAKFEEAEELEEALEVLLVKSDEARGQWEMGDLRYVLEGKGVRMRNKRKSSR